MKSSSATLLCRLQQSASPHHDPRSAATEEGCGEGGGRGRAAVALTRCLAQGCPQTYHGPPQLISEPIMTPLASVPAEVEQTHETGISRVFSTLKMVRGHEQVSISSCLDLTLSSSPGTEITKLKQYQQPSESTGVLLG